MARRFSSAVVWGAAYLAVLAGVFAACWGARDWARTALGDDDAVLEWENYRAKMSAQQASGGAPVQRYVPRTDRPPWLVMLDQRFPVVVAFGWMFATFFFGFVFLMAHGGWRRTRGAA